MGGDGDPEARVFVSLEPLKACFFSKRQGVRNWTHQFFLQHSQAVGYALSCCLHAIAIIAEISWGLW
jgi:hypothetical protein